MSTIFLSKSFIFVSIFMILAGNAYAGRDLLVSNVSTSSILRFDGRTGAEKGHIIATGLGSLVSPQQMAIGPDDGFLYVADASANLIKRYDLTTGLFIGNFTDANDSLNPIAIRFFNDGQGTKLFVLGGGATQKQIRRYSAINGAFEAVVVNASNPLIGSGRDFLFMNETNDFLVLGSNNKVIRFTYATGQPLPFINSSGNQSILNSPRNIIYGPDGNIWISSQNLNRITRFNSTTGAKIDDIISGAPLSVGPTQMQIEGNDLFVANGNSNNIIKYNLSGVLSAANNALEAEAHGIQLARLSNTPSSLTKNYVPTVNTKAMVVVRATPTPTPTPEATPQFFVSASPTPKPTVTPTPVISSVRRRVVLPLQPLTVSISKGVIVASTPKPSPTPSASAKPYVSASPTPSSTPMAMYSARELANDVTPNATPSPGEGQVFVQAGAQGMVNPQFIIFADFNDPPVADAGPDFEVFGGEPFTLDATGSYDSDGDALTMEWTQISGPRVTLPSGSPGYLQAIEVPKAPYLDNTLLFQVKVYDGSKMSTDVVAVHVRQAQDSDKDGMPDQWELANGLNRYSAADAAADPDGDGQTNVKEFEAGTDPKSNSSIMAIIDVRPASSGGIALKFTSVAGRHYKVEDSTDLLTWKGTPDLDDVIATSSETSVIDATPISGRKFFRVRVLNINY